jgi:hypothetical protein
VGDEDWRHLQGITQTQIMDIVRERFRNELGYRYAFPFPIWEEEDGKGALMYYMIHATDHEKAPGLMFRAYKSAIGPYAVSEQMAFADF